MKIPVSTAATSASNTGQPQLRLGTLNAIESLGQSIANIAPTLTPALNVAVVVGLAGVGSWLSYLISTVGLLFVGGSIATLAKRHPLSGSYFVYIGRTFGPVAGILAGWALIAAYLGTAVAVTLSMSIFLNNCLAAWDLSRFMTSSWIVTIVVTMMVLFAVYRDIRLSSRIGLTLEALSIGIVIILIAVVVGMHGTVIDAEQFPGKIKLGSVMSSLTFAVFSFVGFESAATLAKETRNSERTVPLAVLASAGTVGLFFSIMAYLMVMGVNDDADKLGSSASPFADMAVAAGLPWAAGIVYFAALISGFACAVASINAASRIMFSMGRYRFFPNVLGQVHSAHQTPHVAAGISVGIVLVITLALTPLPLLDAFGYTGTFATFGFLLVYLLISIVSPADLHKAGLMKRRHAVVGGIGALLMVLVIVGSVYPVPPYPYNWLPYLFALYMLTGAAWVCYLKLRAANLLVTMEHDMEEV